MPDDGLPLSEVAVIDHQIRERVRRAMDGAPGADDLSAIAELNQRRIEVTTPKLFDEARQILARIAAAR